MPYLTEQCFIACEGNLSIKDRKLVSTSFEFATMQTPAGGFGTNQVIPPAGDIFPRYYTISTDSFGEMMQTIFYRSAGVALSFEKGANLSQEFTDFVNKWSKILKEDLQNDFNALP